MSISFSPSLSTTLLQTIKQYRLRTCTILVSLQQHHSNSYICIIAFYLRTLHFCFSLCLSVSVLLPAKSIQSLSTTHFLKLSIITFTLFSTHQNFTYFNFWWIYRRPKYISHNALCRTYQWIIFVQFYLFELLRYQVCSEENTFCSPICL